MVYTIAVFLLGTVVFGTHAWGPTDCAFSVWSEWRTHSSGTFQLRTRDILRNARQGGRPCVGGTVEYRTVNAQPDPGFEGFLSMFLAGNAPSFNLAGGGSYTLSRDFVILLDTTINAQLFPYYKSLVSNILGRVCGRFGSQPSDNRVNMASFDSSDMVRPIHPFSDEQRREIIQDKVLRVSRSEYSTHANIISAADFARTTLHSDTSGTRRYNNATKEVLLVTSSPEYCSRGLTRALNRLRTVAEVYILNIGRGSCLESLASSPTEFHFRQLENLVAITDGSELLLDQSSASNFCVPRSDGGQHY